MSKIAQYLNEHILGDVTTDAVVRRDFSTDAGMLTARPELVIYPRVTSDIRKIARFAYQLVEKGHMITITSRGGGSNTTGASIGKGIALATTAHMGRIFEFDAKQRLIRLQPGVSCSTLNEALKLQGYYLPALSGQTPYSTIAGAVSNGAVGCEGSQSSAIIDSTSELEVVLANGDVIQTRPLSKRELSKKMAQTDFEGEIYRAVETLIEDNQQLIDTINTEKPDAGGYASIARVRSGSTFDLTPLFVGAQGTLGVISEMIMKVDFYGDEQAACAIAFSSHQALHDMLGEVRNLSPHSANVIDGRLIAAATAKGYQHEFIKSAQEDGKQIAGLVVVTFADFNERSRKRKLKRCIKLAEKFGAIAVQEADTNDEVDILRALMSSPYSAFYSISSDNVVSPLFSGAYIPSDRFEEFLTLLRKLEAKQGVTLPYTADSIRDIYTFYPQFTYRTVQERQKMLKAFDMFAGLVAAHGGSITAAEAEGRMKAPFVRKQWSPELTKLYNTIHDIFNPRGTLNNGVKQPIELREVVGMLRPAYSNQHRTDYTHHI